MFSGSARRPPRLSFTGQKYLAANHTNPIKKPHWAFTGTEAPESMTMANKDVDDVMKLRETISRAKPAAPTTERKANLVALLTSGR